MGVDPSCRDDRSGGGSVVSVAMVYK
jgi:hypothetical protein